MAQETYLYLYDNLELNKVYIGIGDSMDRVWQSHNPEAEALRDVPGTTILQTVTPFSKRADARKAEAIAIHIAARMGKTVIVEDDEGRASSEISEEGAVFTVNRAGVESTKELGPAVFLREGEVDYSDLRGTAIVTIKSESMDDRPAPYGGVSAASFSERARQWWSVGTAKQPRITRLIAVLSGSDVILGDWDVDPAGSYGPDGDVFPLCDPEQDDPRGVKGMRLVPRSARRGGKMVYSSDLRG
ncbi:MAG: hypothetical protein QM621_11810 [Aeromicrobium sp.]|uniref:hypothetical protein n=1 Tax=Aeromicrobium sp. TaxID=1871063 RepID=UPI0039E2F161